MVKRLVFLQPNSATGSNRHRILDPEGVVHTAQAEGLGLYMPRKESLSPVRASHGKTDEPPLQGGLSGGMPSPRPSAWALWTTPSGSRIPCRLMPVTAFGGMNTYSGSRLGCTQK